MNLLRSVGRYVALGLPGFEVALADDDTAGVRRPCVHVRTATPTATTARGATHREHVQTVQVLAYPTAGMNPLSSMVEAARVERLLRDAFTVGLDQAGPSRQGGARTHPMRLPLYDYDGLGLYDAAGDDRRVGFARLLDVSFEHHPVEGDDSLYMVAGQVRAAWSDSIARPPLGETVDSVNPRPVPQIVGGVTVEPGP